jgi:hypothetical protein
MATLNKIKQRLTKILVLAVLPLQRGGTATAQALNENGPALPKALALSSRHHLRKDYQGPHCHIAFCRPDEIRFFKNVGYEFPWKYKGVTVQIKVQQADLVLLTSTLPEVSAASAAAAAAADGGQELVEVLRFTGDIHTAITEEGGEELAVHYTGSNLAPFANWRIFAYEEVRCMITVKQHGDLNKGD